MKDDNIAGRIRAPREQAQMQPAELRRILRDQHGIDLSKTGLHRLETTEAKNPNLKLIQAIAEITRVSPSWILFGEGTSVPGEQVGAAIRSRVIDTIELMVAALDLKGTGIPRWPKTTGVPVRFRGSAPCAADGNGIPE